MKYIYMDNFRGFSKTLVQLKDQNFLVGENSTGKTSFLSLLYLLSRPNFWIHPDLGFQEEIELGCFNDIVSVWTGNKSSFQIGIITTRKDKNNLEMKFGIFTFSENEGYPKLIFYSGFEDETLTIINLKEKSYFIDELKIIIHTEEQAVENFNMLLTNYTYNKLDKFKDYSNKVPSNLPLLFLIISLKNIERKILKKYEENYINESKFDFDGEYILPRFIENIIWMAPIRSKPKRIYDGLSYRYSPEGEHTPLLLRKNLKITSKSTKFMEQLKSFGNTSGLFEAISAHPFGKENQSPFEILIKLEGALLNINNVGYGISQVLPLVVEFLTAKRKTTFAIQQPEVHLHPKAQAALGNLIYMLSREYKHSFFIETHSDYLIDRYRLLIQQENMSFESTKTQVTNLPSSQVLFFIRNRKGNLIHQIQINNDGSYAKNQPKEFREFFIKEEMSLLGI